MELYKAGKSAGNAVTSGVASSPLIEKENSSENVGKVMTLILILQLVLHQRSMIQCMIEGKEAINLSHLFRRYLVQLRSHHHHRGRIFSSSFKEVTLQVTHSMRAVSLKVYLTTSMEIQMWNHPKNESLSFKAIECRHHLVKQATMDVRQINYVGFLLQLEQRSS